MAALIEAARAPDFPAEIVVVISNRSDAGGLQKAAAHGIPTRTIESRPFGKDRAAFEAVLQSALEQHGVELICLGGFMRLFTAEFVQRWHGRMLNIHPSLLPSFPGLEPQAQALRAGVTSPRHRAFCHPADRRRSHCDAGRGRGLRWRHAGATGGADHRDRAPHCPRRCGSWRAAASGSRMMSARPRAASRPARS